MFMKRGNIAVAVVLLLVVQATGAAALCFLPCCPPVPQQCHSPEQPAEMAMHSGHHAGMHHSHLSSARLKVSAAPVCNRALASVVATVSKATDPISVQAQSSATAS